MGLEAVQTSPTMRPSAVLRALDREVFDQRLELKRCGGVEGHRVIHPAFADAGRVDRAVELAQNALDLGQEPAVLALPLAYLC